MRLVVILGRLLLAEHAELVDRHDARMVERLRERGFPLEARLELLEPDVELGAQDLQRDREPELAIDRAEHVAVGTLAHDRLDLEPVGEQLPDERMLAVLDLARVRLAERFEVRVVELAVGIAEVRLLEGTGVDERDLVVAIARVGPHQFLARRLLCGRPARVGGHRPGCIRNGEEWRSPRWYTAPR